MLDIILGLLVLLLFLLVLGSAIYWWGEVFDWFDGTNLFMALLLTLLTLLPVGYLVDEHIKSKAITEITVVQVEVIEKKHSPATTTMVMSGQVLVPIHKSERYDVKISDGELKQLIDNKDMYEGLEVGDKFRVNKITYIDKKGKILEQEFKLIVGDEN